MKARLAPWLCAGLLAAVLPLAAQPPSTPPGETTEARIGRLVRDLDSPRFKVRDRAMKELQQLGKEAVPLLKKALAARPSVELRRRAQILLEPFTPVKSRLLTLWDRCYIMGRMQIQVLNGTKALARAIDGNAGQKPSRANRQEALRLAGEQLEVIREADRAIRVIQAEGSAVAFQEVFAQVRDDMKNVEKRLRATEVGKVNLALQQDIIDTLDEMVKALTKHRWGALAPSEK
jgi:hypothetical protein